jgi:cellobiose phosphorylase
MNPQPVKSWEFIHPDGTFRLDDPQRTSALYLPLVNEAGMVSVVTPNLHGDTKTGQHTFLTPPESVGDLHNTRSGRNFWVYIDGFGAWSAAGASAAQATADDDQVSVEIGFLWHKLVRSNPHVGLSAEIINLVPPTSDQVELMRVTLTNITDHPLRLIPTAAIPIYGRSADNLRDHRHVTSLLQRIHCRTHSVVVRPTLSFDERGHQPNTVTYAVLGAEGDSTPPVGFYPTVNDFIGEGGALDWPQAVVQGGSDETATAAPSPAGTTVDGYEALGGLRFKTTLLQPGRSCNYILILAIIPDSNNEGDSIEKLIKSYGTAAQFEEYLQQTNAWWQAKLANLAFKTGDDQFNLWAKWVAVQPIFRRMFGNSYLPYHDYGRGGRGWRDLWQDILALMPMDLTPIDGLLHSNFAGVRIDGSNATIIGSQPGEFKADRNNIPRVWMDHGAWPLLTTRLYLDQTGDLAFLLREQAYFKDRLIYRAQLSDDEWQPEQGTRQLTANGDVYSGSVLEHLLVQHLTAFFNVGEHNNLLTEGADWNDGMDMARQRGESVAFSAFYCNNLHRLSQLVRELSSMGIEKVELLAELLPLLDTLNQRVDYESPSAKQNRLKAYFDQARHTVKGEKIALPTTELAADLQAKADWLAVHLRRFEWIENQEGYAWFNGYYDNDGKRLEGNHPKGVRMVLTGQVFELMGRIATPDQARQVVRAVNRYLFDPHVGGVRLNTDFGEVLLNVGRCFGYAYGHKENGAMFSHMAVMYAYALYERGLIHEGYRVLDAIYQQAVDFPISRMYPGIPEYFDPRGRGMYPYLTGSASWFLLTYITQVFGAAGKRGDLALTPRLVPAQFGEDGTAALHTLFARRILDIVYHNPSLLDYGAYRIDTIRIDGQKIAGSWQEQAVLPRNVITSLEAGQPHRIDIELAAR